MNYDVIVLPIIEWDHRFQRPQHIASAFAGDGHRVFYVNLTFLGQDADLQAEPVRENLWRIALPGPADHNRFLQALPDDAVDGCVRAIRDFARDMGIGNAVILVQQPFWARVALRLRQSLAWKIVYDCMDEHDGLTALTDDILKEERVLAETSDLVVTTSRKLATRHESSARRHLHLPNAGDFGHFSSPGNRPDPLPGTTGPIIGYYGAIMDWFDADMVHRAATLRPDWTFLLIGTIDTDRVDSLKELPNVRFTGEKPYAELPAYLHRFDVALIPFRIVPIIEATNPVKFYEYLAAGKPVVATAIPELKPFGSLHYLATNGDELVAQAEVAMAENSPAKTLERTAWARGNTWADRFTALKQSVDGLWGKASIIVVSYKNPDRIRDCLESLARFTDYPDYEVIVVDNGSDSDVVEFLREFTGSDARFKLIEAGENLGFAKANNRGLDAISLDSEYVIFLNNDTVVTEGWLAGLIRWLQDPTIGLIGPTTWPNGTANEAAIPVPYQDMAGMHVFAARHVADNRGIAFDIPMLAFYCVGLRREVLARVGPLDEGYGMGMFEDDDYAIRIRNAGYRVVCARDVFIHHVGRASFGQLQEEAYQKLFDENRKYYETKWSVAWRSPSQRHDPSRWETREAQAQATSLPGQADLGKPTVSVILVNYNGLEHLEPCLSSLSSLNFDSERLEIIVVDNASVDESVPWLERHWPRVRIIENRRNVGFSKACNQGVELARGDHVAFLNNDMRVDPEWLNALLEVMSRDVNIACAGSLVLNWDGSAVEFSGRHDDPFSLSYEPDEPQRQHLTDSYSLFVSGGAMLVRKADFIEVGGFDRRYFMYHEDVDVCWRLWTSGRRCCVTPHSVVYHRGGASSAKLDNAVVLGWGQKHLLWTVLKNFDDENLRTALPLLIYFLVERGRWSEACLQSLREVFEETQAALGSILHERTVIQGRRVASDEWVFERLGHPLAFIMRSPLFTAMAGELAREHPADDLDFRDPGQVADAMIRWFEISLDLHARYGALWKADAAGKFVRRMRLAERPAGEPGNASISSWGPRVGREGEPLNASPSGNSSLWVTGENLYSIAKFVILDKEIQCIHVGDTLTCELPEDATRALMAPGTYPVTLRTIDGRSFPLGEIVIAPAPDRPQREKETEQKDIGTKVRRFMKRVWS